MSVNTTSYASAAIRDIETLGGYSNIVSAVAPARTYDAEASGIPRCVIDRGEARGPDAELMTSVSEFDKRIKSHSIKSLSLKEVEKFTCALSLVLSKRHLKDTDDDVGLKSVYSGVVRDVSSAIACAPYWYRPEGAGDRAISESDIHYRNALEKSVWAKLAEVGDLKRYHVISDRPDGSHNPSGAADASAF